MTIAGFIALILLGSVVLCFVLGALCLVALILLEIANCVLYLVFRWKIRGALKSLKQNAAELEKALGVPVHVYMKGWEPRIYINATSRRGRRA